MFSPKSPRNVFFFMVLGAIYTLVWNRINVYPRTAITNIYIDLNLRMNKRIKSDYIVFLENHNIIIYMPSVNRVKGSPRTKYDQPYYFRYSILLTTLCYKSRISRQLYFNVSKTIQIKKKPMKK